MKQKIRFRMRWDYTGYDPWDGDDVAFAIRPENEPGWGDWRRRTGMLWWPVCGRRITQ